MIASSSAWSVGEGSNPRSSPRSPAVQVVDLEGIGLAPRPIQRLHELGSRPLPKGFRRDEAFELGYRCGIPTEIKQQLKPIFGGVETLLVATNRLELDHRHVCE